MSHLYTALALVFPLAAMATSAAASPPVTTLPPPQGEVPKHVPDLVAPNPDANPFAGAGFAIDSSYVAKVESSVRASPADSALLKKVEAFPTAVWLDSIESTARVGNFLDEARAQERQAGKPIAAVFVIYNLPDRDCSATASAGQLSSRTDGEMRYRKEFIDPIVRAVQGAPKAARRRDRRTGLAEANLATNLKQRDLRCCGAGLRALHRVCRWTVRDARRGGLPFDAAHAGGWMKSESHKKDDPDFLGRPRRGGRSDGLYTLLGDGSHGGAASADPLVELETGPIYLSQLVIGSNGEIDLANGANSTTFAESSCRTTITR